MLPRDVICFSKDWHEAHTSNHHVLRALAGGGKHRVLWVNSLATRKPNLTSGRDLGKIARKLREQVKGPVQVEPNLWVYTPLVLPLPHAAWARQVNRRIIGATFAALRARLGFRRFQLWTFLPTIADYVDALGGENLVYYCVDDWALFSNLDEGATRRAEEALCRRADVVFGVNRALVEDRRPWNPHTYLAPHGVDHAAFARALDPTTPVPEALDGLPRPIIGFYGTLADWVDLDLVAALARRRPDWSFALVGPAHVDLGALTGLPNVRIIGSQPHGLLPSFCKGFDVGLIPYRMGPRMRTVSPLKAREYLSAGLPVVSTRVPEVETLPGCRVVNGVEEAHAAIVAALAEGSPGARRQRSEAMRAHTWEARVADVVARVEAVAAGEMRGAA